jgi:hypothetical protein
LILDLRGADAPQDLDTKNTKDTKDTKAPS